MKKNYPGNKNYPIAYTNIINQIPPHKKYWELYAGSASIYRKKLPAAQSYLNEIDPKQYRTLQSELTNNSLHPETIPQPGTTVILNQPAIDILKNFSMASKDNFIYLDPPYPISSRHSQKEIYKHEMNDNDHIQLLETIKYMTCNIMISSYHNRLYDQILQNWRKVEFTCRVHQHTTTEVIYMNYDKPKKLHDYRYLGKDCWDRQRIKRKIERITKKINSLPTQEKNAILNSLLQQ